MKAKLLKKLRKECSWKHIQTDVGGAMIDHWVLLQHGSITYHSDTQYVVEEMVRRNAMYEYKNPFTTIPWDRLWIKQLHKIVERQYHQVGKPRSTKRQAPPPPPLDRKGQKI